jgi:hypothetical protein
MAAGVPPVVLSNRTEAYMVKHNETGLVASDEESYVRAVERLYRDPALRRDLSVKARAFARERFSMERMVEAWQRAFEEALQRPKEPSRQWPGRKRGKSVKPYELFLESVAGHEEPFLNLLKADSDGEKAAAGEEVRRLGASCPLWRAKTRGTPGHYSAFFPEDPHLKEWSERLRA